MRRKQLFLLLLPMISAQLRPFDYGQPFGDQVIPFSGNQHAATLELPVVFLENSYSDIYISPNGIVGLGDALPDVHNFLPRLNRSAIAVYYAPYSGGVVYYRSTTSDQHTLQALCNAIYKLYADSSDFACRQGTIVTWDNVASKESEEKARFQLALASDGVTTYALMQFTSLPWSSSGGVYAQSGFAATDGVAFPNVNSGGPEVKELMRISNTNNDGSLIFRISGSAIEDPTESDGKDSDEDYDYGNLDQDYDGEKRKPPADCPEDKFKDRCPDGCNVLVDDRECSKCVCAGNYGESSETSQEGDSRPDPPPALPHARYQEEERQEYSPEIHNRRRPEQVDESRQSAPDAPSACGQAGEGACHADAQCRNHDNGYCCSCNPGFMGNGKECVRKGDRQRVSGTFEAVINGKTIDRTDLHTFIQPTDGSAYTSISKIPSDVSAQFLFLNPINSIMGWLFADVQFHTAENGMQLTGGVFNRTVTMHIGDRYYVTFKQSFTGRDVDGYFKTEVFVSGTLPDVAPGSEIVIPDYDEDFRKEGNGLIRSYTGIDAILRENGQDTTMRVTIDQQIRYNQCPFRPNDKDQVTTLQSKRVHITYESDEGTVRYASKNYAGKKASERPAVAPGAHFGARQHGQTQQQAREPVSIPEQVCAEGRHVCTLPNMRCRPYDQSYRCECVEGFAAQRDSTVSFGWSCQDINECERDGYACSADADCTNFEGGYNCQCRHGFTGDGRTCISMSASNVPAVNLQPAQPVAPIQTGGACTSHQQCHQYGECVFTEGSPYGYCKCRGWMVGDGVTKCGAPEEQKPVEPNVGHRCGSFICDQHAECMPDTRGGSECVCKAGYAGNGVVCESLADDDDDSDAVNAPAAAVGRVCRAHSECSKYGSCAYNRNSGYYECKCDDPYIGNGVECTLAERKESRGKVCRSHDECSEYGSCAYSHALGYYQCACREGYAGNGVECYLPGQQQPSQAVTPGCDVLRDCHPFADCIYQRSANSEGYACVCKSGYSGDGKYCTKTDSGAALPPLEQPGCDRVRNCHQQAQCVFDDHNRKFKCECNEGYIGDGLNCVKIHGGRPSWEGGQPRRTVCREQSDCHRNGHCVSSESGSEYVCECLPGFKGDGVQSCTSADQCNPADQRSCRQNAECVFGNVESAYVCKCISGFTGDGHTCVPHAAAATCREDPRQCHANAQCVLGPDQQSYVCMCKPGSIGDGYQRCDVQEVPRCTGCSVHAHCAQNPTTGAYHCKCNAGYQGNGQICASMSSCLDDRSLCDAHAECVPGEGGNYVCNCHYGYHGNGRTCTPDTEGRTNNLYISRGMAIFQRGMLPDVPGKQVIVIPHHIAVGLDFDCETERLVWSDITGHSIRSASYNGTDLKSFFSDHLSSPEGIAVDYKSRNVYYADSKNDEIGVASLDGKYKKTLVSEGLVNPRSVVLDLNNRHVYYADWHRENPVIGRVDMDGKNNKIFLNNDIHLPNGLTILPNRKELCWVDAGNNRLSCIGLDGNNRRVVYSNLQYPFGVTHDGEERFYWTDWKDNRIHTVGVFGDSYASFPISLGGSGKVYGITSVPKTCHAPQSPCAVENGGCKYLCLPGSNGAHCECPDNVDVKGCSDFKRKNSTL